MWGASNQTDGNPIGQPISNSPCDSEGLGLTCERLEAGSNDSSGSTRPDRAEKIRVTLDLAAGRYDPVALHAPLPYSWQNPRALHRWAPTLHSILTRGCPSPVGGLYVLVRSNFSDRAVPPGAAYRFAPWRHGFFSAPHPAAWQPDGRYLLNNRPAESTQASFVAGFSYGRPMVPADPWNTRLLGRCPRGSGPCRATCGTPGRGAAFFWA